MGDIGYGCTKTNIQYMATDFCQSLGKNMKSEKGLSSMWFNAFIKQWPDLKLMKPQKLQMSRAKSASKESIDNYFRELGIVLQQNDLMESPARIFNIDETGISLEHASPKIVCAAESNPQAVTSARSSNVTIIAGANAIGNHIPPFYIFPGKRWCDDFLTGAPAGSAGKMSESRWSNTGIFEYYVTNHLAKHVKITENNAQNTLILYDGHKFHISLTLTEWAKQRNVILFVLSPHTCHITQPLDVGVFGPLKCLYNRECQAYLQKNPGISITKYEVARLTSKSPENIVSAFRKSGIYPYNAKKITPSQVAPATIYEKADDIDSNTTSRAPCDKPETQQTPKECSNSPESTQAIYDKETANDQSVANPIPRNENADKIKMFFADRKITQVVQKPKKKFIPSYAITGSLMKKSNIETLTIQAK